MDCDRHAIICITLAGHTAFVVLPAARAGSQGLPGLVIGYGVIGGVLFALWRGYGWARWLLFGFCVIGSLGIFWLAFKSPSAFAILQALHLMVMGFLLAAMPSVSSFLASQRAARRGLR